MFGSTIQKRSYNATTFNTRIRLAISEIQIGTCNIYIEINTWPFPYQPEYHPETPISARDGVLL